MDYQFMSLIFLVLYIALSIYVALLVGRMIVGWLQVFAPRWHPTGPIAVIIEMIFVATDQPLKSIRRVVPPLRLGQISLDVSFMIVFFAAYILMQFCRGLAGG